MIRWEMPGYLRALARVNSEVKLEIEGALTLRVVLDAQEARYSMVRETIRGQVTQERWAFLRFYWCERDL